jgi:type II secretory pathway predicted ATPase ExeA
MIETHFGLRRRPFRATPDSAGYYPATTHEQALARILQALADDEGLILLTAAPGMGKTLLCHVVLERLGAELASAFLTNSHCRHRLGLLQAICFDLSLPHEGRGEQELRLALTDSLLRNYADGRRTVLVVDEAHHLAPDLLEELRLLGNLEAGVGKALRVILVAQPSIHVTLARSELAAFRQRLAVRPRLEPLGVEESADYLLHQVRAAGGRPDNLISEEALEILARGGQGVPRLLNQAAHQALLLAHAAGASQVDAEAALEALPLIGLEPASESATTEQSLVGEGIPDTEDSGPVLSMLDEHAGDVIGRVELVVSPKQPA